MSNPFQEVMYQVDEAKEVTFKLTLDNGKTIERKIDTSKDRTNMSTRFKSGESINIAKDIGKSGIYMAVIKKVEIMKESVDLDESFSVYKPLSPTAGKSLSNKANVKSFKTKDDMFTFLGKGDNATQWKETGVTGLKNGIHKINMVRGKDGKPAKEFIKEETSLHEAFSDGNVYLDADTRQWGIDNRMILSKAQSMGHKLVAICGARISQGMRDYPLVSLTDFDKQWVRNVKLKSGEYIFRIIPAQSIGEMPLVKVNPMRGLIYFLTDRSKEEDFVDFETKSTKLSYFRHIKDSGIKESEEMTEASIKVKRAKNDQDVSDRLKKLKAAGINAHSSAEAQTHINVDSKDVEKAKKILGNIVESGEKQVGWIAMIGGKKLEIRMGKDADSLYSAKMFAIDKLNVPKSKHNLMAIKPAYESVDLDEARMAGSNKRNPNEPKIIALQRKHGYTWDKAEKIVNDEIKAQAKAAAKALKSKAPRAPRGMTTAQFDKMMKNVRQDFLNDNPGSEMEDVAYDMADSLMYDKELYDYVAKTLAKNIGTTPDRVNRQRIKEYIADTLA